MTKSSALWLSALFAIGSGLTACSVSEEDLNRRAVASGVPGNEIGSSDLEKQEASQELIELKKSSGEQLLSTVVLNLAAQSAVGLTDGQPSYSTSLEEKVPVTAEVAAEKYLNVVSKINFDVTGSGVEDIGCIYIDLKDNVSYREQSLLRIASTEISGDLYEEISVPLLVKKGDWRPVPVLGDSLTLAAFAADTVKKFKGELCFQLDLSNLPAQSYSGDIIVQYLLADGDCRDYDEDVSPSLDSHTCGTDPKLLRAAQQTSLSFAGVTETDDFQFRLSGDDSKALGELTVADGKIIYQAPTAVAESTDVFVIASKKFDDTLPEYCPIKLIADEDVFEPDDGVTQALVGNVYPLDKNTAQLPDFSQMTPTATVMMPNFAVATRKFDKGFPGLANLVEWFGIEFTGQLWVPESCDCRFRLNSDDGANLYIDGVKVIDNDGLHAPRAADGEVYLEAGLHDIKIDYYQGPRYLIALELFWQHSGTDGFEIIEPDAFFR